MNYLFISPHVDDSELMAGGTIAKLIEEGHKVDVITLSCVYDYTNLSHEWESSMNVLGVNRMMIYNFNTRLFHNESNEILQTFYKISNAYDFVFCPCASDFHSDHSITSKAAIRAFKHINLISWLPPWNQRSFIKNYFVKLESRHVQKKLNSLNCYKSQLKKPYFNEDVIVGEMAVNGMMCNARYSEAFQVINLIA